MVSVPTGIALACSFAYKSKPALRCIQPPFQFIPVPFAGSKADGAWRCPFAST